MWGLNLVNIAHGIKSINLIYVGFKGLQRFDNGNRRRSINLIYVGFKDDKFSMRQEKTTSYKFNICGV